MAMKIRNQKSAMKMESTKLLLVAALSLVTVCANASETIAISPTSRAALLDGQCGNDEWEVATRIELPAQASIHVMHDSEYFYLCAKAKEDDHTVLDLYIENAQTGHLHRFHLSAQMGESVLTEQGWSESAPWDLDGFAGFWVPYAGLEDPGNRSGPRFARGTHRQIQISRNKFPGITWNIMIGVSGVTHEGERAEFLYPEGALDSDASTWRQFSFSE
ncbi:hypothetical protein [Wenzhouxiangella marina]|uniref:hypothetical protein n=1 Tax=Wenzhouxiangella marina TaxID=1579979 RepID=UPI001617B4C8|nr:hypothetical protein [Wenzhouxiangella marina]MBB6086991.1 hypothetical protein [Wenzhouxiangella marina]